NMWGVFHERVLEPRELQESRNEAMRENANELQEHAAEHERQRSEHVLHAVAPTVRELEGEPGARGRVHNLLEGLHEPRPGTPAPRTREGNRQGEPAAPAAAHTLGGDGADAEASGVPYWPSLIETYRRDLHDLEGTERHLRAYREGQ